MFSIRKPSQARIQRFLDAQGKLPFSYSEIGVSRNGAAPGYPINHYRRRIGTGEAAFERAAEGMRHWKMYDLSWTRLCWPDTPIAPGATVVVQAWHLVAWSLNACRIIYVIEEDGAVRRYGFAFGTLPAHIEQGEERFTVEWHRDDDSVWYELFAFARPKHPLARIGYPVARLIQKQFAWSSARAMQEAATGKRYWDVER